jgi:hypothetical protein
VPEQVPHVRVLLLHVRIPRRFHGLPAPASSRKCRQQQEISLSLFRWTGRRTGERKEKGGNWGSWSWRTPPARLLVHAKRKRTVGRERESRRSVCGYSVGSGCVSEADSGPSWRLLRLRAVACVCPTV